MRFICAGTLPSLAAIYFAKGTAAGGTVDGRSCNDLGVSAGTIPVRVVFILLWIFFCSTGSCCNAAGIDCHVGAYSLSDGSVVDIAPDDEGRLRWLRFDGTTGALQQTAIGKWTSTYGWTNRSDGKTVLFGACDEGSIKFSGVRGKKIDLATRQVVFQSDNTALAGRLIMPPGSGKVPVVVLLHGSEQTPALDFHQLQRLLPAHDVGIFVYDKRGTGLSQGTYTQDFEQLADDAVAAMHEAKRLAGSRLTRIGYHGGSQGGWVAPIAASREKVDFVIVAFGLAVSVIEEDQQEVEIEMQEEGHSVNEISQALEVARAAESVIASHFTQGFSALDAVRAKYSRAPWYKDLRGNYTYMLLPYSEAQLRELANTKFSFAQNTPFFYNPLPTLRAATVPELWILGGEDYQAPSAVTKRYIQELVANDHPFTLAYYPDAEHGITLFDVTAGGQRVSTRYAPGYFQMIRDFARDGKISGPYGDAALVKPHDRNQVEAN